MKPGSLIALLLLLAACSGKPRFPEGGYGYPAPFAGNREDSFLYTWYRPFFYNAWNEPDLTRQPAGGIILRLIYTPVLGRDIIISFTADTIMVKKELSGSAYPGFDVQKLTREEAMHYRILRAGFPPYQTDSNSTRRPNADSLLRQYPQLADTGYFKYLLRKSLITGSIPFRYSVKTTPINHNTFTSLLKQVNQSGFWAMPRHFDCDYRYLDGWNILLEINTPHKYKSVSLSVCTGKSPEFSSLCRKLINAAGLKNEIQVGPDNEQEKD